MFNEKQLASAKRLSEVNPEDVAGLKTLGKHHFVETIPTIEAAKRLCEIIMDLGPDKMPQRVTSDAADKVRKLDSAIERMTNFEPESGPQVRERTVKDVVEGYEEMAAASVSLLAWGSAFSPAGSKAREVVTSAIEAAKEAKKAAEQAKAAADAAGKAAATAAIRKEAAYFAKRAFWHSVWSGGWLALTLVALAALGGFAWSLWEHHYPDLSPSGTPPTAPDPTVAVIGFLSARLVVLAVLGYALAWAARNHRAHRHNEVVNRHRALALQTFEAFERGISNDPQTRNAILLQAAQCAFSPQITGYMTGEPDPLPHNTVVEVLKAVGAPPQKS